jgi:hypothetical protein
VHSCMCMCAWCDKRCLLCGQTGQIQDISEKLEQSDSSLAKKPRCVDAVGVAVLYVFLFKKNICIM